MHGRDTVDRVTQCMLSLNCGFLSLLKTRQSVENIHPAEEQKRRLSLKKTAQYVTWHIRPLWCLKKSVCNFNSYRVGTQSFQLFKVGPRVPDRKGRHNIQIGHWSLVLTCWRGRRKKLLIKLKSVHLVFDHNYTLGIAPWVKSFKQKRQQALKGQLRPLCWEGQERLQVAIKGRRPPHFTVQVIRKTSGQGVG